MSFRIPPRTMVVSVGMQRAGSAWYFSLTHDLWVANGGQDIHQVRTRYHLEKILSETNCNMGKMSLVRLLPVLWGAFDGHTYVAKSHSAPTPFARLMIRLGWVKVTYLFRDPRDAALSGHEYGQRVFKNKGRPNSFTKLHSIERALEYIVDKCRTWEKWTKVPGVLITRYEDLLMDYDTQVKRLTDHLELDMNNPAFQTIVEQYRPGKVPDGPTNIHLYKGQIGRFRQAFTLEQKEYALKLLQPFIERMGYSLE